MTLKYEIIETNRASDDGQFVRVSKRKGEKPYEIRNKNDLLGLINFCGGEETRFLNGG